MNFSWIQRPWHRKPSLKQHLTTTVLLGITRSENLKKHARNWLTIFYFLQLVTILINGETKIQSCVDRSTLYMIIMTEYTHKYNKIENL